MCVAVCTATLVIAGCGDEDSKTEAENQTGVVATSVHKPAATKTCIDKKLGRSVANTGRISQPDGSLAASTAETDNLWIITQFKADEPIEVLAVRPSRSVAKSYGIKQSGLIAGESADATYGETKTAVEPTWQTIPAYVYFFPSEARAKAVKANYDKKTAADPDIADFGINRADCPDCQGPASRKSQVQGNALVTYANRRVPAKYERLVRGCVERSSS